MGDSNTCAFSVSSIVEADLTFVSHAPEWHHEICASMGTKMVKGYNWNRKRNKYDLI